jgi:hypothetical protein
MVFITQIINEIAPFLFPAFIGSSKIFPSAMINTYRHRALFRDSDTDIQFHINFKTHLNSETFSNAPNFTL